MNTKRKKKNRITAAAIAAGVLCVLVAAYAIIVAYNKRAEAERDAKLAAKNTKVVLTEQKSTDVKYIEYTYEGETIKLEYKNNSWYNADDSAFPLDQTKPSSMAATLASAAADRLVEESADDFSKYGLDEPNSYIYVRYADGTGIKMLIGDYNEFTGSRYMNIEGTRKVYLVSSSLVNSFRYKHNDLMIHDKIPSIDFASVTEISVTTRFADGTESTLRYYKESAPEGENDAETAEEIGSAAAEEAWLRESDGGEPEAVQRATVKGVFDEVMALRLANCVAYNVRDDEALQKYGLGSASAKTVTIKYTEKAEVSLETSAISSTAARTVNKEFAVSYSAPDEDGNAYVNIVGSRLVYSLNDE